MMTVETITDLLLKHLQGTLSVAEQEGLDNWLSLSAHNRHLFNSINDEEQLREQILAFRPEVEDENEAVILAKIHQLRSHQAAIVPMRRAPLLPKWVWAAASVVLLLGIGTFIWKANQTKTESLVVSTKSNDILPGKDGAILTLADGRQVVLDSLGNGVVALQNGSEVVLKNGELAYAAKSLTAGDAEYNTLTTPKGRQFQITLQDGTRVWLNAASSLRYPTAFVGKERRVEVTGEVYFEVAKNAAMPFKVNVNNQAEVEVLGTAFNVNAYTDEASVNTTLLEGSVKVSGGTVESVAVLKPGQQAQIRNPGAAAGVSLSRPDTDKVMAWKNGFFNFENATLEEVMRQLERWYDIDVVYEKGIPNIRFGGKLSRDVSLAGLLKSLEESEVHFRITEGRKLIVMP